jgi:hypothetical protein
MGVLLALATAICRHYGCLISQHHLAQNSRDIEVSVYFCEGLTAYVVVFVFDAATSIPPKYHRNITEYR